MLDRGPASQDAHDALVSLEHSHERLLCKVNALYSLLDIPERFPNLDGVSFEFIQTLLLARNLKINIRKRALIRKNCLCHRCNRLRVSTIYVTSAA